LQPTYTAPVTVRSAQPTWKFENGA
jgi:hypothetical protein